MPLHTHLQRLPPLIGRFVPFVAVAAANSINLPLMRQRELKYGVPIYDDKDNKLGMSSVRDYFLLHKNDNYQLLLQSYIIQKAAQTGIALVVFSRIFMAVPGMG